MRASTPRRSCSRTPGGFQSPTSSSWTAKRLERTARAISGVQLRECRDRGDLQPHGDVTRRPRCIRGARKRLDRRGIAPQGLSPAEREQRGRRDGEAEPVVRFGQ